MNKLQLINWSEELDIGVLEIDLQHRRLVVLFNDLLDWMDTSSSLAGWENIVYQFQSYALYHFHTEEALANKYGYGKEDPKHALTHYDEHKAFIAHIREIQESLNAGENVTKLDVMTFIHGWLINHIGHDDMPLGNFICANRAAE